MVLPFWYWLTQVFLEKRALLLLMFDVPGTLKWLRTKGVAYQFLMKIFDIDFLCTVELATAVMDTLFCWFCECTGST